jgi:hypothetical protein
MWRGGNFSPHELFLLEQKKGQVKTTAIFMAKLIGR